MSRLAQIQALLEESPEDAFLNFAIAKEYEKLEQPEKALNFYRKLVEQHPDYVGTYYHYGKLREQAGAIDEALDIYQSGMDVARRAGDQHALGELAAAKLNLEDL